MAKLWEKRTPPKPLQWPTITEEVEETATTSKNISSQNVWSIVECCKVFEESVKALSDRLTTTTTTTTQKSILIWDKDDEDAMKFVTSAANLRCFIFNIKMESLFNVKSLAGNIIPAIATTNAIVAGLIVLQAIKVLSNQIDQCRAVYVRAKPVMSKFIVSSELVKPNSKCYVCASKPEILVKLDIESFTVKQFETKILKKELNMIQPDVEIDDGTGRIILSSDESETEQNNDKTLSSFGLTSSSTVTCDDFFQHYEVKITLIQCDSFDNEIDQTKGYQMITDSQTLTDLQNKAKIDSLAADKAAIAAKQAKIKSAQEAVCDIDLVNGDSNQNNEEKKRSYENAFNEDENNSQKQQINGDDDHSASPKLPKKQKTISESDQTSPQINNNNNNTNEDIEDDILCSSNSNSNSINDASDAISDDDDEEQEQEQVINGEEKLKQTKFKNQFNHHQHHHQMNKIEDDDVNFFFSIN
jgi:ubiquitin-like 1-activating enzyme E1 B